jgi:acyl carrier protein
MPKAGKIGKSMSHNSHRKHSNTIYTFFSAANAVRHPASIPVCASWQAQRILQGLRFMSETFDRVADIIAETSEIDRAMITPESNTIDDLGIDSLDFLDIVFAVDKEFGIKIPLEKWTQDVNDGKVAAEEYFVMGNLVAKIDALIAAKNA